MGNDGGSIPKRRELVREAARDPTTTELKESQHEQQEYHWTTDPLSRRPLQRPIVSDANGKLYNKDSIIEYLLPMDDAKDKEEAEIVLQGAVKSLKDVVDVKFQVEEGEINAASVKGERWVCPVTNKVLGPGVKSVYLVPCGHAFSESAVREIAGGKCLQCNEEYAPNDVIPILPTSQADIARLSLRMKALKEKQLTHSLKKAYRVGKKRKKDANTAPAADEVGEPKSAVSGSVERNIKNAATANLTAKVMEEQMKRRKLGDSENLRSLFSSRDQTKPSGRSADFMSRGFTMPEKVKE